MTYISIDTQPNTGRREKPLAGKTAAAGTQPGSNLRIKVDAAAAAAEKAASGESRAVEHVAELHPSQVPACLEQCLNPKP